MPEPTPERRPSLAQYLVERPSWDVVQELVQALSAAARVSDELGVAVERYDALRPAWVSR